MLLSFYTFSAVMRHQLTLLADKSIIFALLIDVLEIFNLTHPFYS